MSAAFQNGKRSRRSRYHDDERRAEEAAVVGEPAGPELRPREAVVSMPGGRSAAPRPRCRRSRVRAVVAASRCQSTSDGIGAEVHVVPEIAVGEDVEEARADDAHEQRREPEIDDDIGVFADAARPQDAHRGGEEEARQQQDEVARRDDVEDAEELRAHRPA